MLATKVDESFPIRILGTDKERELNPLYHVLPPGIRQQNLFEADKERTERSHRVKVCTPGQHSASR